MAQLLACGKIGQLATGLQAGAGLPGARACSLGSGERGFFFCRDGQGALQFAARHAAARQELAQLCARRAQACVMPVMSQILLHGFNAANPCACATRPLGRSCHPRHPQAGPHALLHAEGCVLGGAPTVGVR